MSYSGADVVQEVCDSLTGAGLLEVDAPLDEIGCALVALIRERDELRAALERIAYDWRDARSAALGTTAHEMQLIARAALAKVQS